VRASLAGACRADSQLQRLEDGMATSRSVAGRLLQQPSISDLDLEGMSD